LVGVEQWAEIRRMHFVAGLSIKEIARRMGRDRNTVRRALRSSAPPRYGRASAGSKLDPFKEEIHRLLRRDPRLPGQRVRELIAPLGFDGGKTIVDDYLRDVRPLFAPPRTFQNTIYRPGEVCQLNLWEPTAEIPVGHGQTRRGWVVVACLGYSRAGAGALILSTQIPELLAGIRRCLWRLGALPQTLVWDRQAGLHAVAPDRGAAGSARAGRHCRSGCAGGRRGPAAGSSRRGASRPRGPRRWPAPARSRRRSPRSGSRRGRTRRWSAGFADRPEAGTGSSQAPFGCVGCGSGWGRSRFRAR
jgi:hypothetical protein